MQAVTLCIATHVPCWPFSTDDSLPPASVAVLVNATGHKGIALAFPLASLGFVRLEAVSLQHRNRSWRGEKKQQRSPGFRFLGRNADATGEQNPTL